MPKAKITITKVIELERSDYRYDPETGSSRTDEEVAKLTCQQMIDMNKKFLIDGDYDVLELLTDNGLDYEDEDQFKMELVDE